MTDCNKDNCPYMLDRDRIDRTMGGIFDQLKELNQGIASIKGKLDEQDRVREQQVKPAQQVVQQPVQVAQSTSTVRQLSYSGGISTVIFVIAEAIKACFFSKGN